MGVDDGVSSITGIVQNLKNEHEVKIIAEGDSRDREKDIEISEDEREYLKKYWKS